MIETGLTEYEVGSVNENLQIYLCQVQGFLYIKVLENQPHYDHVFEYTSQPYSSAPVEARGVVTRMM